MSFSEASNIITQTGTDTDLSGLNGVTGVTTYTEEDMIIYDVASTHRITIEGTVHHDPEKEVLIIRHDWVSGSTPALHIVYSTNAWTNVTGVTRDSSSNRLILTTASAHGRVVGEAVEFQVTETGAEHLHQVVYPVTAVTTDTLTLGMTEYSDYLPTLSGSTNRVTRRAVYNYGREITDFGNTRLSAGTGLLFVGNKENNFQERGAGIKTEADGLFRGRGGVIYSSRPTALNGYSDIDGTELVSPTLLDCRNMSGGALKNFKLVNNQFSGAQATKLLNIGFNLTQGTLMETLSQSYYEVVLRDFDTTNNIADSDIGHSSDPRFCHRDWVVINPKAGSSIRGMFRSSTGINGQAQKGVAIYKKEVSFNLNDSNGDAIQDVEMHMVDTPDSNYSKNATFPAPTQTGHAYTSKVGTNTLGVLNGDGTVTYDYTNAIEYTGTSDASGLIDTIQVTIGVQILEYLSGDPSASSQGGNGGPYDIALNASNQWVDGGVRPAPSDWDTTRFDGFYKVDRRGNGNTDADLFTFKFCSYGHMLSSTTQALKGLGELEVDWVLFDDALISETSKTTVDDYIAIIDSDRFYDRAKAYLIDNYAGEENTLVTRSGLTIDAGDKDIVLDPSVTDAASAFAFDSGTNTLTIKCTSFTGNLTTTGEITVNSGVTILGTIIDVNNQAGLSSRTFSVSNIILGTTIQIYNETQVTKRGTTEGYTPTNVYETLIASGTTTDSTLIGDGSSTIAQLITAAGNGLAADPMADTSYVLPSGWKLETTEVVGDNNRVTISGIYDEGAVPNGDFNIGDSVRIRATCAASTGAFLPFVNTTIANEGGFSIRVNQQPDTIYNNNGIDGSDANYDTATLTLTPDYTNLQIDVLDSDTTGVVTVQQIYAKYAYLITTTQGIENFFGAITAENTSNYRINTDVVDLKIQNISANDTILTGARLYRSDNTTVLAKGYLNNDQAQGLAGTISHDTGEFLQYIQPQVEAALNAKGVATSTDTAAIKTDTEAVKKKTNLIPGLL